MVGYIYIYTNVKNGKVYIGQTTDIVNRKSAHKYKASIDRSNNKFYNAVRKYGWDSFTFNILVTIQSENIKDLTIFLDAVETFYIWKYNSFKQGYNSTAGGHCYRGKEISEKFREYCKHRTYSEETRKKMSESARRKFVSEATKEKYRQNALKRNFAAYREITTEKRNAAIRKAKAKAVLQLDKQNNVVNEFSSIKEAVLYVKMNIAPNKTLYGIDNGIRRHCKGITKREFYYGFKWEFKTIV